MSSEDFLQQTIDMFTRKKMQKYVTNTTAFINNRKSREKATLSLVTPGCNMDGL